jgi:hypothetical protein
LGGWTFATFALVFAKDGLTPENRTHVAILLFLSMALGALPKLKRLAPRLPPRRLFLIASIASAAVVEGAYMISAPLHPSLLVTAQTTLASALRNFAVDVLLTTPAYVAIFGLVWWLVRRFAYRPWEYALFIPVGQALGDGQGALLANPSLLVFLPYLMANYQAMSLAPYLAVQDQLDGRTRPRVLMYLLPIVLLPLTYGLVGTIVILAGKKLGLLGP